MRTLLVTLLVLPLAAQRSQTDVYTFDANGRRQLDSRNLANGGSEQRIRTLNGGMAPVEKVEERVIREDANGKVTERIVRPFDGAGNALPPVKLLIAESKGSDGSRTVDTQTFQGTINGGFALAEKSNAVERTVNGRTVVETQIARPTLNGTLDTVERRNATQTTTGQKTVEDTVTYRRDNSGSFYTAARQVKETDRNPGRVVENSSTYVAESGKQLELSSQAVAETVRRPDGSESRQVDLFGTNSPGRPVSGQLALRERQMIEKTKTAGGAVETLSIRRPAVDNPNALGPAQKISEKVCSGDCQ